MSILHSQKGSAHMTAILGVLVIALTGFAGYRVMESATPEGTSGSASNSAKQPAKIDSSADAKKAANALDDEKIDGEVNPNQLDDDIGLML